MAEPTFNQTMVTKLQDALAADPLGKSVSIDGTSVTYADAIERLRVFESRLARENGTRPRVNKANLSAGNL
jgi:hypothetical protein